MKLNEFSAKIKYLVVALPILLIAFQSYFKSSILTEMQTTVLGALGAEALYWFVRLIFFVIFVLFLTKASLDYRKEVQHTVDLYEKTRLELDPLLGLRALACINVFFGHWFLVVFGPATPPQSNDDYILRLLLSFSPWCGVWIFFTLSGYLMGKGFVTNRHATNQDGLLRFYYNRVRRIFPIYFITILFVVTFIKPEMIELQNLSIMNAMLSSLLFDDQGKGAIGALWSISTEFQFYLLAPFLFIVLATFSNSVNRLIILTLFFLGVLCIAKFEILLSNPELWHGRVYFPLLSNIDCFVAGMSTAFIVNSMRQKSFYIKNGLRYGIVLTVLSQIVFSVWSFHEMASFHGYPGSATRIYFLSTAPAVTSIMVSLIIFLFEVSERTENKPNALWSVSMFIGSITYCLYVLHEPVFASIRKLFPSNISIYESIYVFPIGVFMSVTMACFFYFFVELYFDKIPYSKIHKYFKS